MLALFDLDETLIDRSGAFLRWAAEFRARHDLPPDALGWLVQLDEAGYAPRERLFTTVVDRFGLDETVDGLCAQYRGRMPELAECFPGAAEGLAGLRAAGWLVGIVTNGSLPNQLGKIRNTGLAEVADGWAISGELGIRKPDPHVFAEAARRCGTSLDAGGWMVGDHPDLDIAAGRGVGLGTVWIHHGRTWTGGEPGPDRSADGAAHAARIIAAG